MTLEHIEGLPSGVALCLGHFPVVGRRERRSSEEAAVGTILCDPVSYTHLTLPTKA